MYKGTNPKAITSQEMLADGLIELLKLYQLSQINIKSLCAESLVSRQTFYSLFDSKEEVVEYILIKRFENYNKKLQASQNIDIYKIATLFLEWSMENKELLEVLVKNNLMYLVCKHIKINFVQLRDILHVDTLKINAVDDLYIQAFIAGALTETLQVYILLNQKTSVEELSALITSIFLGKRFSNHYEA